MKSWTAWNATKAGLLIAALLAMGENVFADDAGDVADRVNNRGERIEERLDNRGDRVNRRLDNKGDRVERRHDNAARRIDQRGSQ